MLSLRTDIETDEIPSNLVRMALANGIMAHLKANDEHEGENGPHENSVKTDPAKSVKTEFDKKSRRNLIGLTSSIEELKENTDNAACQQVMLSVEAYKTMTAYFTSPHMTKRNLIGRLLSSQIGKVNDGMSVVSVDLIDYRIFGDAKAIIRSWNCSITLALPRNCVAANGHHVTVIDLRGGALSTVVKAILIPYSLHTISGSPNTCTENIGYLVFEFGSRIQSIPNLAFTFSRLRSVFFSAYCLFH
jgi:hypothetical protein